MTQIELEEKIKHYQKAYYNGNEEISDAEFDELWETLESNYPNSPLLAGVGQDSVTNKIKHIMVMGSLYKFNTEEGLRDWVRKESIVFPVQVSCKIDGNSCELQYKDGKLLHAVTRGDSVFGEDITSKALGMNTIPNSIPCTDMLAIRGEIVMNKDLFEKKYSQDFKNPRNLTAGLLKNESFVDYNDLRFIAYDMLNTNRTCATELEKAQTLESYGFDVVESTYCNSVEEIIAYRSTRNPRDREYAIDGLVLKQNTVDPEDLKEIRPKKQHAFKWGTSFEETILTDIEWHMQGSTLTPIAIFNEIFIDGSLVHKATLHNLNFIQRLDLEIGDRIGITKFGEIIPGIAINLSKNIKNNNYVDY